MEHRPSIHKYIVHGHASLKPQTNAEQKEGEEKNKLETTARQSNYEIITIE